MLSFLLRPRALFVALFVSLPFTGSGGCSSGTACFAFTMPEFMVNGNMCPTQSSALANFSDPSCPGSVVSVDGPGSFDGQLCCYPVTQDSITPDCNNSSGSGVGGAFTTGSGFGGFTTTEEVGSSSSGPIQCTMTCAQAIQSGLSPCGGIASTFFVQLQTCAGCFGGGTGGGGGGSTCVDTADCGFSLCINSAIDPECTSCLETSCASQFSGCENN